MECVLTLYPVHSSQHCSAQGISISVPNLLELIINVTACYHENLPQRSTKMRAFSPLLRLALLLLLAVTPSAVESQRKGSIELDVEPLNFAEKSPPSIDRLTEKYSQHFLHSVLKAKGKKCTKNCRKRADYAQKVVDTWALPFKKVMTHKGFNILWNNGVSFFPRFISDCCVFATAYSRRFFSLPGIRGWRAHRSGNICPATKFWRAASVQCF